MSAVIYRVVDLETGGKTPDEDVLELATLDVSVDLETKAATIGAARSQLFGPTKPIPVEAMAVHHLTMRHLGDKAAITVGDLEAAVVLGEPRFLVSHNARFERQWLVDSLIPMVAPLKPASWWICTMFCAKRLWPDAPKFSNQALRYWLDLDDDPDFDSGLAMPPHSAGADVYVTAHILTRMLDEVSTLQLVQWTMMPEAHPRCPIGDHAGKPWPDVPHSFLTWMIGKFGMEEDLKAAARAEVDRRRDHG